MIIGHQWDMSLYDSSLLPTFLAPVEYQLLASLSTICTTSPWYFGYLIQAKVLQRFTSWLKWQIYCDDADESLLY